MVFAGEIIHCWEKFIEIIDKLGDMWVFRGQSTDDPLKTTLERACDDYNIPLREGPGIEEQMIRDFRRRYRGEDRNTVLDDTLYCLALMQHYGSPTRLLDWTYSPFVAAFFALEKSFSCGSIVWCLNTEWCENQAASIAGKKLIAARNNDKKRDDTSFTPLYMNKKRAFKLVYSENPIFFHERLIMQRGLFLCPGDISQTFENNLKEMRGWNKNYSILRIRFQLKQEEHKKSLKELNRMNVSHAVLFPGLDGFARSLKQKLPVYVSEAKMGIGQKAISNFSTGRVKPRR